MFFMDPIQLTAHRFKASLAPGYRFDYGESGIHATVEVVRVRRGELIELDLLVVDDTYSRLEPPRKGDRFEASFQRDSSPFYGWMFYPEGHFRRYEEWRRRQGEK